MEKNKKNNNLKLLKNNNAFLFIITLLFTNSLLQILYEHNSISLQLRIMISIILLFTFAIGILFPIITILIVIFIKTQYLTFLLELMIYLIFFIILLKFFQRDLLYPLSQSSYTFSEISPEMINVFNNFYQRSMIFNQIFLLLIISSPFFLMVKKPIFLVKRNKDSIYFPFSSTLIEEQAKKVREFNDGFSERPVFINFKNQRGIFESKLEFQSVMKKYIKFLSKNGELINYVDKEDTFVIYPRFLVLNMISFWNFIENYKTLLKILRKKNISSISIQWPELEMSISINRDEYKKLDNKTYFVLCQTIATNIENSILLFKSGKYEDSFEIISPSFTKVKMP